MRSLKSAESGIMELQKSVDTLIIIPNQNLFRVANEKTTVPDAFAMADQVLYSGVACITDLVVKEGLINLDFADVRAVMREMGKAMMGTGEASGDKRALRSAEAAISNPLMDDVSLRGARGLLISITGGKDFTPRPTVALQLWSACERSVPSYARQAEQMSRRSRFGTPLRNYCHINSHAEIVGGRADKAASHRNGLADIAGHRNPHQIAAVDRPVRRVVCDPAGSRKVDVGPCARRPGADGGGVTVVQKGIVKITRHDARSEAEAASRFDQQHGEVAT